MFFTRGELGAEKQGELKILADHRLAGQSVVRSLI